MKRLLGFDKHNIRDLVVSSAKTLALFPTMKDVATELVLTPLINAIHRSESENENPIKKFAKNSILTSAFLARRLAFATTEIAVGISACHIFSAEPTTTAIVTSAIIAWETLKGVVETKMGLKLISGKEE